VNIHSFIKQGRLRLGMSQQQFAHAAGVSRGAVQQWEKPGGTAPRRGNQARLAELLGVSIAEMMAHGVRASQPWTGIAPARVPLLPLHEVVDCAAIDNFRDIDGHETIPVSVPVQRHTFAMQVRGDAMTNLTGDSFPDGSTVVVEPDLEAKPDDYIVVVHDGHAPALKQLVRDGELLLLKPLNPRYPVRPLDGADVIGVVRAMVKHFR